MLPILVLLIVCTLLPLFYSWRVFRLRESTWTGWLIVVAETALVLALTVLIGRWDIVGFYTRLILIMVFAAAVFWSFFHQGVLPWGFEAVTLKNRWTTLASLAVLLSVFAYVLSGLLPPSDVRNVAFPLVGGRFVVAQGGGVGLLNYHASHAEQRFAADITAIGPGGFRAESILPDALESYEIYGKTVVSPCAGEVIQTRSDLPDLIPPNRDPDNPAGNHVIIACAGMEVEIAHLQQESVSVAVGDAISTGDFVGLVGNSGNTTEPHLHVHAVESESRTAVPLTFCEEWPVRNHLYAASPA